MKEFIKNKYNIEINKINKNYFYYENEKVIIKEYSELKNTKSIGLIKDKRISQIILNKENEIYTKYKNKYIVLFKINDLNENIDLDYLNIFNINNNLEEKDIIKEWTKQVDEIELEIKDVYKDYYIGLAEIAISMLFNNKNDEIKVIGHNIKFNKINKEEMNNPLNFVKVDILYNVTNYLKYKFFNDKLNMNEYIKIINGIKNINEIYRFMAYMIYPNYYFETKDTKNIVKKHKDYEKILLIIEEKIKKIKKSLV